MTVPLPWSLSKDDPSGQDLEDRLQENFDKLAQQFPVAGGNLSNDVLRLAVTGTSRKVAFGSVSLTWTAAVSSAQATVTHGLGGAPVAVIATGDSGLALGFYVIASSVGATTFDLQGVTTAAVSQTHTAYWLAVA